MSRPRRISAEAAARRALLVDALCAIALALVALTFCAGLGIVGVIAVLTLIAIGLWFATEALVHTLKRR
ncbi:MAG TPA: hypothetical protein VNS60_14900 [Solirubrobacterales bacterium]|nr:hypothetical protein [Solirubrobacterales bacterium]